MTQSTPTPADRSSFRDVGDNVMASPRVDEKTVQIVKDKLKALNKLRADEVSARYKIEIMFGVNHTVTGLAYGVLTLWENGSKLGGGGDSSIYVCPGKSKRRNECEGLISDRSMGLSKVLCPSCYTLWSRDDMISDQFYRLPLQRWADVVLYWFVKTGMDADIKLKYSYKYKNLDIRGATAEEKEKHLRGELLNKVRDGNRRVARLYPLKNIIADTSAGADLYTRFLAFVRS